MTNLEESGWREHLNFLCVPKSPNVYAFWLAVTTIAYGFCITIGQGTFLRAYFGDVITVSLLHSLILLMVRIEPWKSVSFVVCLFVSMEIGQAFHYVRLLGLEDNLVATTVLGTTFCPIDLVAYLLGAGVVVLQEWSRRECVSSTSIRAN